MSTKFIPQMEPWFDKEEQIALSDYMAQGGWITEFKQTQEFERMLAEYVGSKHCIAVNNGTISLSLMAIAAGIEAGDEVLVPNFTMVATPNSLKLFGAQPVFVDVDPTTLCIDLSVAKEAITNKTKAMFLVNANGRYPKNGIESVQEFCEENNLILLEDAAQSLGSSFNNGVHQGTVGLAGSFSFSAPKIISTGQGGAIVTNSDEMNHKVRRLKDFGRSGGGNDIHDTIGFNFKFTDLQAVVGISQMKKLQWRVERKKDILRLYQRQLASVDQVKFFDQDLKRTTPWFNDVMVEDRESLMAFLKQRGIGTRIMYPPINRQKAYEVPGDHPVSFMIGEKGLWIPSAAQLTDEEVISICDAIKVFYS